MSGSNVRVVRDVIDIYAAIALTSITTHIGTRHVILAKHRLWLPDDGFM
jgi:hypothetical protein